jgi:hypothetical protein
MDTLDQWGRKEKEKGEKEKKERNKEKENPQKTKKHPKLCALKKKLNSHTVHY